MAGVIRLLVLVLLLALPATAAAQGGAGASAVRDDWQNADRAGNLIENDHLDLLEYRVARGHERGIYLLFTPIHTHHAGWSACSFPCAASPGLTCDPARTAWK